jgi:hypothetical protein
MMKKGKLKSALLTLIIIFTSFLKGYSIGNETQVGARELSMGNASVALISTFSVFHNQAALARLNGISVAIDYRQPFLIEGLSDKALAVVVPTSLSNFALGLQQKGIQDYHESRFGFAMARKFGEKFSAGLQFDYFMIDFPEQGRSRGTFFIEFGLLYQTKNNVIIGLHIFDPAGASIESLNNVFRLPVTAACGIALKPLENLLFTSALDYYSDSPLIIRMGIEYQFSDRFFLRFGLSGKPIQHSAGLGYKWNIFHIDFALMHHETLGYTPTFSLILNI